MKEPIDYSINTSSQINPALILNWKDHSGEDGGLIDLFLLGDIYNLYFH